MNFKSMIVALALLGGAVSGLALPVEAQTFSVQNATQCRFLVNTNGKAAPDNRSQTLVVFLANQTAFTSSSQQLRNGFRQVFDNRGAGYWVPAENCRLLVG